ncbi:mitochondrial PGP phosphatase-domain-containing protein [Hygrophoropsis aurantiaca]|uniref:Mitochondrial PGP phosphatase-domain-containing protein n=1 Tax=Hygrophoropsis aurantiaca TaxID=72124 RepID=A0ACB8A3W3_9AGAM|nr:mitochondrial PGP phosphatase-domain-containing protein [Hygrophoropsis aurantiaca]
MPLNIPGLLVPLQLLWNPRLVVPHIVVKDIRQLDFIALRKAGYKGAVFDKDNCLTIPHQDQLVPELQEAWQECRAVFGPGNVLVVSNSAGTRSDTGEIQAESVSRHLGVPVLRHATLKPGYSCIAGIRAYFTSLPAVGGGHKAQLEKMEIGSASHIGNEGAKDLNDRDVGSPIRDDELVIVGDRIFTDVVMANRMATHKRSSSANSTNPIIAVSSPHLQRPSGPLAIWTTGVWQKESMTMRWCERKLVDLVRRRGWGAGPNATRAQSNNGEKGDLTSGVLAPKEIKEKTEMLGQAAAKQKEDEWRGSEWGIQFIKSDVPDSQKSVVPSTSRWRKAWGWARAKTTTR